MHVGHLKWALTFQIKKLSQVSTLSNLVYEMNKVALRLSETSKE